jgi:prepilin-type N-terminal cleavage/methylation domain-containing protein
MARTVHPGRQRPAFTLIELIVVILIILILAGLLVVVVPKVFERQQASQGAAQVQSWLLIAKQRALRDQAPRGIRLNVSANGQYVTELQYIEQPEDFYIEGSAITGKTGLTVTMNAIRAGVVVDFYGGFGAGSSGEWPVQVGDFLEINGGGPLYVITQVIANPNGTSNSLNLAPLPNWSPPAPPPPPYPPPPFVPKVPPVYTRLTAPLPLTVPDPYPTIPYVLQVANTANISVGCFLDLDFGTANQETVYVSGINGSNQFTVVPVGANQLQFRHALGAAVVGDGAACKATITNSAVALPANNLVNQQLGTAYVMINPQYRIIRQPRVLAGEDALQLPTDVAIDLQNSLAGTSTLQSIINSTGKPFDILFGPSGAVIGDSAQYDKIILWVRDVTQPVDEGDQTLVCTYGRTGLTAAHPVNFDASLGNFYVFTQDGRSSGK